MDQDSGKLLKALFRRLHYIFSSFSWMYVGVDDISLNLNLTWSLHILLRAVFVIEALISKSA